MFKYWDSDRYNIFKIGKPQPGSVEKYICLPSTPNCVVIAYPRKNKIIFTVADNPRGLINLTFSAVPTLSPLDGVWQTSISINRAKEMKGPAAKACEIYAGYMKELLDKNHS